MAAFIYYLGAITFSSIGAVSIMAIVEFLERKGRK